MRGADAEVSNDTVLHLTTHCETRPYLSCQVSYLVFTVNEYKQEQIKKDL